MAIIIGIVIFLFIICLYLLFNPLILSFNFIIRDTFSGAVAVRFAPFEYKYVFSKKKTETKKEIKEIAQREKTAKPIKRRKKISYLQIAINEFEIIKHVLLEVCKFIGRLLKFPDRYFLNISVQGSLGSPDMTGEAYGVIESIKPMLGESVSIAYQPDFLSGSLSASIIAGMETRVSCLIKEMLIFTWKLPKLGIIRIIRKLRKGG
ncbi:MAG: hypothetical protein J7K40_03695 [candidate division Zixibacteria bacterium]|nr:hypothetical protein [candidate division Zixibacteria bacterium]